MRVVRPRFPLGTVEETLEYDHVRRAIVEESTDSDGTTYRVTLVLVDGRTVPLTRSYGGGRAAKERTVAQIDEALARRD